MWMHKLKYKLKIILDEFQHISMPFCTMYFYIFYKYSTRILQVFYENNIGCVPGMRTTSVCHTKIKCDTSVKSHVFRHKIPKCQYYDIKPLNHLNHFN